jgi:ribosomal-protein-serine acetyltransferase
MTLAFRTPATEIQTDQLILRARNLGQIPEMFHLIENNRLHLREWMPWEEHSKTERDSHEYYMQAISWWQEGRQFDYSIYIKPELVGPNTDSPKLIGSIAAYEIDWVNRKCLIGFWLAKDFQGKGLISESLMKLEEVLLDLGLHRLSMTCDRLNKRSQNVAIRNQYLYESKSIDDCIERNKLRDTLKFTKIINRPIEGAHTLNLPDGFCIRELEEKTFWELVKEPMKQIFNNNQMILNLNSILSPKELLDTRNLRANISFPCRTFLTLMHGQSLAGWCWGYQDSYDSFFMVNSAILTEHRGRGLYSRLLEYLLEKIKPKGFQRIWSLHNLTNNPVIIAKLKRGFYITGVELSETYGTSARLTHFTNKDRIKALEFRAGDTMPDEAIRHMFGI